MNRPSPTPLLARAALLMAVFALHGCDPAAEAPDAGGDAASPAGDDVRAPDEGIRLAAGIEHASYAPGDSIRVRLSLANRLDEERTLEFATSQRYDFRIVDEGGNEVYRWSEDRSFAQALGEERLPARSEGPEWEEWIPAPLRTGRYRIVAIVPALGTDLSTALPVEISNDGAGGVD